MAEPITARGVIAYKPGEPGVIEEFLIPQPGPGEALVKILASGVCHTDLSAKNGVFGTDYFPFLLGHEGAGIVEAVGDGVTNVAEGDYVILAWRAPCGQCRFCLVGQAASLRRQSQRHAEDDHDGRHGLDADPRHRHLLHAHAGPRRSASRSSKDLPPEQMSLIGCGVMTGVGAALYTADVQPGQSVAVIGCGGVGDSVIMGAKLAGATTIIAVDIDPRKLEWAKGFGATHTVNPKDGDPVPAIKEITGGFGVNASFEAVGKTETLLTAIWSRDLAGTCVVIGVADRKATFELNFAEFFDRGGAIKPSWYGDCLPTRDFPASGRLVRPGTA